MKPLAQIESAIRESGGRVAEPVQAAAALLELAEAVLEHWIDARGERPTAEKREGFRLLALHRQGAKGLAVLQGTVKNQQQSR